MVTTQLEYSFYFATFAHTNAEVIFQYRQQTSTYTHFITCSKAPWLSITAVIVVSRPEENYKLFYSAHVLEMNHLFILGQCEIILFLKNCHCGQIKMVPLVGTVF